MGFFFGIILIVAPVNVVSLSRYFIPTIVDGAVNHRQHDCLATLTIIFVAIVTILVLVVVVCIWFQLCFSACAGCHA